LSPMSDVENEAGDADENEVSHGCSPTFTDR
jgi:hypothetical protein